MTETILKTSHILAAIFFAGFIFTDRAILRRSFTQSELRPLYIKATIPTLIASAILIASGIFLLLNYPQKTFLLHIKAAFGLLTIALFFTCPFTAKFSPKVRFAHRAATIAVAICAVICAKLL
jgi:uncharacterized membrane protein